MIKNTPFTKLVPTALLAAGAIGMLATTYSTLAGSATNITAGSGASCSLYDQKYCIGWDSSNQMYSWCCPLADTCGDVTTSGETHTATCI